MRNTAILPGKDKLEDMIASIDDGYFLTETNNGQADTTGEFMFGVCMGLKAGIKGLEFLAGLVQIIGQNWLFSLLMIVVPVLHFTLTRSLLKRRVSVLGKLTGANWMAPLGAWLLSAILIFAGVVLGLRGTAGEPSDRQLLMTRFDAEASLQSFGAAPEFLLDVKYNVLRIAGEETVEYYLVQDGKDPVQVTPTPAPENS